MTAARVLGDVITVVRAVDQLLVSVILEDLELVEAGLTPTGDGPGFLTVVVPPQHTVESIPAADPVPAGPYANRVSGSLPAPVRDRGRHGHPLHRRRACWAGPIEPWSWTRGRRRPVDRFPRPSRRRRTWRCPRVCTCHPDGPAGSSPWPSPARSGAITELWRLRLGREQTVDDTPVVVEPPDARSGSEPSGPTITSPLSRPTTGHHPGR